MQTIFLVYSDILRSTRTTKQAEQLIQEIDKLLASLYHEGEKEFEKALQNIRSEVASILRDEFLNKDPKNQSKEMIKEFLTQLKERAQSLRAIQLTLAFSPSEHTIEVLHEWVLKNIGENYVLDIEVDQSIIGGARLVVEGKYIDLSVRTKMDEVFGSKKEEIIKILQD